MMGPKAYYELSKLVLDEMELEKFEWAVGAMLAGGHPNTVVLEGPARSGKSTLMRIARLALTRTLGDFSPPVSFQTYVPGAEQRRDPGFDYANAFIYIEANVPTHIEDSLVIRPTGGQIPVNKYHVLMTQIETTELDMVADICINRYRALGGDHYITQENTR